MSSDTSTIAFSAYNPPMNLQYFSIAMLVVLFGLFYLVSRTETFKSWSACLLNWKTSFLGSNNSSIDNAPEKSGDEDAEDSEEIPE